MPATRNCAKRLPTDSLISLWAWSDGWIGGPMRKSSPIFRFVGWASDNGALLLKQNCRQLRAVGCVGNAHVRCGLSRATVSTDRPPLGGLPLKAPVLQGLWAATEAGLGIALRKRDRVRPANVHPLSCAEYGLPDLPSSWGGSALFQPCAKPCDPAFCDNSQEGSCRGGGFHIFARKGGHIEGLISGFGLAGGEIFPRSETICPSSFFQNHPQPVWHLADRGRMLAYRSRNFHILICLHGYETS